MRRAATMIAVLATLPVLSGCSEILLDATGAGEFALVSVGGAGSVPATIATDGSYERTITEGSLDLVANAGTDGGTFTISVTVNHSDTGLDDDEVLRTTGTWERSVPSSGSDVDAYYYLEFSDETSWALTLVDGELRSGPLNISGTDPRDDSEWTGRLSLTFELK